ncbi:MAG: ZIP family metal transporter [Bacilli bacterium]|nr:ZIP family metal transporter [Bacilli bacterium]
MALLVTLLSGIAFFIGYFITRFIKNEKSLVTFSIGFAFSIIFGLIAFDILPEIIEFGNVLIVISCAIGGIALLKLLDIFVPEHEHGTKHKKDHIEHIGIISAIALFLHNIIEGTAIYTTALTDIKMGTFMALGVAFHNIPLGIQISSLIHEKKNKLVLLTCLAFSSILGVLVIGLFNISISPLVEGILLSVTFGMLIYLLLFELLCEVRENIKKKELIIGLLTGLLFIILGHFIG